jgi:hypothetical protein
MGVTIKRNQFLKNRRVRYVCSKGRCVAGTLVHIKKLETPDDFVFSLKEPRFAVSHCIPGEAGPSIAKRFDSGISEIKSKIGPILW